MQIIFVPVAFITHICLLEEGANTKVEKKIMIEILKIVNRDVVVTGGHKYFHIEACAHVVGIALLFALAMDDGLKPMPRPNVHHSHIVYKKILQKLSQSGSTIQCTNAESN